MADKRKDNKGRLLKTGESQRKDGTYMYRYSSSQGKRKYVYAKTLTKLREKELAVSKDIFDGIDPDKGNMTVGELIDFYFQSKRRLKETSRKQYAIHIKALKRDSLCSVKISSITRVEASTWLLQRNKDGIPYHTLSIFVFFLRSAFRLAIDEGFVRKNPFNWDVSDYLEKPEAGSKEAISKEDMTRYLEFLKNHPKYGKMLYHQVIILTETGMRIGEFCGLTIPDVDLYGTRTVIVDKQLQRGENGKRIVISTKSASGTRQIPLSDLAFESFRYVLQKREIGSSPESGKEIDGKIGFVFLNRYGNPQLANSIREALKASVEEFNASCLPEQQLPNITPHSFRHYFSCSMMEKGVDLKVLQYVMGHQSFATTANHYGHLRTSFVLESIRAVINMR